VSARFEKRRVLVVDDNPDIVDLLKLILASASQNIQLASASSGLQAIELVRNNPPHLIILDVMMPGMNGIELITRLRKLPEGKRIPILVLTGYDRAAGKAREAGADEILLKPVDRKVFVEKVIALLKIAPPANSQPAA
jgi:CheY-like chemotaxis protein